MVCVLAGPSFPRCMGVKCTSSVSGQLGRLGHDRYIPFTFEIFTACRIPSQLSSLGVRSVVSGLGPGLHSVRGFSKRGEIHRFCTVSTRSTCSVLRTASSVRNYGRGLGLTGVDRSSGITRRATRRVTARALRGTRGFSFSGYRVPMNSILRFKGGPSVVYAIISSEVMRCGNGGVCLAKLTGRLLNGQAKVTKPHCFGCGNR